MVRSLQLSPKYELDFPHQSTTGTPLSLCWSLLNEKSVPNLILSHGTQITCFAFESNQNWLIERIIQLDEICSHVIGFPHTTLIMLALSPDCTAPFTLVKGIELSSTDRISRFLELIPVEHIKLKYSLDSEITFRFICSIQFRSRECDIFEKLKIFDQFV